MDIWDLLLNAHSGLRWLIVIVAVVAIVAYALVWLRRFSSPTTERGLMTSFIRLMELQFVLGVLLIIGKGITTPRIEHAVTMLIAVALVHAPVYFRGKLDAPTRARNNLLVIIGTLVVVFVGVAVLPQGWLG